ncbi:MAG: DUF5060 domain-containing protein [Pirellulaceae bacterium]|nr:DUF5060 domain-containing protein [Pirellulaceae bacterium]
MNLVRSSLVALAACGMVISCAARGLSVEQNDERGEFSKWRTIELRFAGPKSRALGEANPFEIRLDVKFRGPGGRELTVPGFYDGDGRGGGDGNVWKVRFAADAVGKWSYSTNSTHKALDTHRGSIVVTAPRDARGLWKLGRLEADPKVRYLKFRDGPYWLKAGCDDPENFLGGYRSYDSLAKRKAAIDYLAGKGVNSLYIMTHNVDGDDKDVWPWIGATAREAKRHSVSANTRFDIPKLTEWRELFEHMTDRGVVPYLILEDDSAWSGYDHQRYWREIIARFGDLPALTFNLGEEHNENYKLSKSLELAGRFRDLDPYHHPLGIHNVNRPTDSYIDSPAIDFTAIQTGSPERKRSLDYCLSHNRLANDWIRRCQQRGRSIVVNFDEGRPEHDRRAWWSAYLGGGVWEAHVLEPYDRPHTAWDSVWSELGGARAFMESIPFWRMLPSNQLVLDGTAFCLAEPGVAYALYLPTGGTAAIELPSGSNYEVAWWDPQQDRAGKWSRRTRVAAGRQTLRAPTNGDWAVKITVAK